MKFKNCKYDHLQLAERFLLAAEKLMPHANEEIDMAAGYLPVNRNEDYAKHFGFDSGESFLIWVIHEDTIWCYDTPFEILKSYRRAAENINPLSVGAIIQRYLTVAKNLMEIKE